MIIGLLLTQILFIIYGILLIIYSFWSKTNVRGKGNKELYNETILGILLIILALGLPSVFIPTQTTEAQKEFFFNLMFIALATEGLIFAYMLIGSYYRTQKDSDRKKKMNYSCFKDDFIANYVDDPKKDMQRKGLHLLPVAVIIICFHFSYLLADLGILAADIDPLGFYYFLILTIALAFVQMFMLEDLCRIWNRFEALPEWAYGWICHSMIPDELDTVLTSTPMVVAMFPFVFTPIPLLFSVGIITGLSDAVASMVGKRFGKHKWPINKKKSIEGTLAAILTVYAAIFACFYFYADSFNLFRVFTAASFASLMFLLVDLFSSKISDNLLNPILCGTAIYFVMYLF